MQSFLLKFSKQISIFPDVNQQFLQTNQKVLHFYIFSRVFKTYSGAGKISQQAKELTL